VRTTSAPAKEAYHNTHTDRPTTNHKTDHPFRLLNAKKKHERQKTNLAAAIVLDDKVNVGHANLLDANVALVE